MTIAAMLHELEEIRIVPVLVIDDASRAGELARTLRDAGVATAEVTLRTPAALEAIREMSVVDGFLVGAGTVLDQAQSQDAIDAGAQYLVSPGLDERSVQHAAQRGIPFLPGVATGTEVQRAHALGLTHVKLFPAGQIGGRALIEALAGPFPDMRFLPSGGVNLQNMDHYLEVASVFAVSGSWMAPRALVRAGEIETIHRLTVQTVEKARR